MSHPPRQPAAHPDPRPDLRLELVSDPRYLCGIREWISQVARATGFDDSAAAQLALAIDEALANVMKHGYDRQPGRPIWLSVFPLHATPDAPSGVRIVIEDEARQVEPESIKGRDLADIRPGGLGVHIIRETMDSVVYEKRQPTGMRLTIIKRHKNQPPCTDCCKGP
jgi:anti-sigma regulatory factor (Ser/Thr protein kinase)